MANSAYRTFQFGQILIHEKVVFFTSKLSYAFVNIKPVVPGHVLVSSRREAPRFSDLREDEVADLFVSTQKVSKVIQEEYKASSLSIAIQDGPDAGQTVPHVHVHILPRVKGDFENNDDIYRELQNHDKDLKPGRISSNLDLNLKLRTHEEMAEEAAKLRSYFV